MRYFLHSLLVCTTTPVYNTKLNVSKYFYQFLAGYGPDRLNDFARQHLKTHYNDSILKLSNCLYEAGEATPEEMELLSSMTAEVSDTAVTTGDIHSILLCLKFAHDPHRLSLSHCVLGALAFKMILRHLATCLVTDGYKVTELRYVCVL